MYYDEIVRAYFRKIVEEHGLSKFTVKISGKETAGKKVMFRVVPSKEFSLPSEEYAIAKGKEVIMECCFKNSRAHVFTAKPYKGVLTLSKIVNLNLNSIANRSIFFCALNAVMRYLGIVNKTIHCRGSEPEICGIELTKWLRKRYGNIPILLVGYQPAFAKALTKVFDKVFITDMDSDNIGKTVNGVTIVDDSKNSYFMRKVKIALITGSAVINSTLWPLIDEAKANNVETIVYGVSAAGVAKILKLKRLCFFGK